MSGGKSDENDDQHHLLRAIRDVARMIEKVEPVVVDALRICWRRVRATCGRANGGNCSMSGGKSDEND